MLRLIIILVLGILIIPHIQSALDSSDSTFSTDAQETSSASSQQTTFSTHAQETSTASSQQTTFSTDAQETSTTSPQETSTTSPQETSTTSPQETSTTSPQETSTTSPQETSTTSPQETSTTSPQETSTTSPQETSTTSPQETSTTSPQETSTTSPQETSTTSPQETSTTSPQETSTTSPQETSTTSPQETSTTNPQETSTTSPQETSTTSPQETSTTSPQETSTASSQQTTFSTDAQETSSTSPQETTISTTTVPVYSSISSITATSITQESTTTSSDNTDLTDKTAPITSAAITSTTTQQPNTPRFRCNFTQPCFGNDVLERTNGSEFNPPDLSENTEQPIAPTSDVTSIREPTSDGDICKIPYRLTSDNSTENITREMWFCYKNECITKNEQKAKCESGLYGLISLDPSDAPVTIIDAFNPNVVLQDSVREQCLRFYYYLTVYDEEDWGQHIQIWLRPDNRTDNQSLLVNLTYANMTENKWEFQQQTFSSTSDSYTLAFLFERGDYNQTEDAAMNKTIHFALDNIELYDYNCSYVQNSTTTLAPITTTEIPPTSTTSVPSTSITTGDGAAPTSPSPSPSSETNFGMIIGLSLGIGIPVLLVVIGGFVLYKKKDRNAYENSYDIPLSATRGRANSDIFRNPYLF